MSGSQPIEGQQGRLPALEGSVTVPRLLAITVIADHVSIHVAFAVSVATPLALAISYAFFFEGYTGLTVTVGAVVTLFVLMQMTTSVRWADVFAPRGTAPVVAR